MVTERQQLTEVCRWNRRLSGENVALRAELGQARQEIARLAGANANLGVEAEAAECLLTSAFTEARRAFQR